MTGNFSPPELRGKTEVGAKPTAVPYQTPINMTKTSISQEAAEWLVGKKVFEVGPNYIKLDNGLCIYLDEQEIDHLNSLND